MKTAGPVTEAGYWNALWRGRPALQPIDPHKGGLRNYAYRHLHREFMALLADEAPAGKTLFEAGCGGSRWLAYFHRTHGCRVAGMDYSPDGCGMVQEMLERLGAEHHIVTGDVFDPPADFPGGFDFVFSNGLLEHFTDTPGAVAACAAFLRPGGLMITLIPNMTGAPGWLQRFFDRELYEKHVPLDCAQLAEAHRQAGLEITVSHYVMLAHLGVIQFGAMERLIGARPLQVLKLALSAPLWGLGPLLGMRPNHITSPFILCAARKPA